MKKMSVITIALAVLVSGCGQKVPGCSDEKTTALVTQIFYDAVTKEYGETISEIVKKQTSLNLSTVTVTAIDEKIGKTECAGTLEVSLPAELKAADIKNGIRDAATLSEFMLVPLVENAIQIEDAMLSAEVEFTSQLTADEKSHLVSLNGHKALAVISSALAAAGTLGQLPQENVATEEAPAVVEETILQDSESTVVEEFIELTKEAQLCVDQRMADFRNEYGPEAVLRMDIIGEWEAECSSSTTE